jgi:hypothetical protein
MRGFSVNLQLLHAAATLWEEQADSLRGARKRLEAAGSQSGTLGDRVGPVATAYFETWARQAGSHAKAAQGHGNALSEIGASYVMLDEQSAVELQRAMPWGQGDAIHESVLTSPSMLPPGARLMVPEAAPQVPHRPGTQP